MAHKNRILLAAFSLAALLGAASASAQTVGRTPGPVRLKQAVNENQRVVLVRSVHPLARAEFDRGQAPNGLAMNRMTLVLKPSSEQQQALKNLLEDQQKPGAANYHRWLTPTEFGKSFGPADEDLQVVTGWLRSRGFQVNRVATGKSGIEFSGTAAQVSLAFRTEIHRYLVKGEERFANSVPASIPAALSPVVAGVASLNNFRAKVKSDVGGYWPEFTTAKGNHYLTPSDYATIYSLNPVYQAGIDGKGSTIAVLGVGDIDPQDVSDFRSKLGLSVNPPQIVVDGSDPATGEDVEGVLDATWSGALAPAATIKFIVSGNTYFSSDLFLSEEYAVDNNVADIITESFSTCELFASDNLFNFAEFLREQAAAQGMTWIVSSGDNGPYGCDDFNTQLAVSDPTATSVNLLAASPYVTSVGGTMFNEDAAPATYWSAQNTATTLGSALSYIPELPWNESCGSTQCFQSILAGSGGASIFYLKPSWQTGVPGIPDDGSRDLPDVSLTSAGHDPYLLCIDGSCTKPCTNPPCFSAVYGTSAAAPSFAGIMALVRQKVGSRLGAINPQLYALAGKQDYSKCNGSSATQLPSATCIFNDITTGNNDVNGGTGFGTANAIYQAAVGYDLATGLGSVNGNNLVNQWSTAGTATTTTLAISPTTLVHGALASFTIAVKPAAGTDVPSGPVNLNSPTATFDSFQLDSKGSAESTTGYLGGGTYALSAVYGGDGVFSPSVSTPVMVTVTPEPSYVIVQPATSCPSLFYCVFNGGPYGSQVLLDGYASGVSQYGIPTGMLTFTDNGKALPSAATILNAFADSITPPQSNLAVGSHSIVASYNGDASFSPAVSDPVMFTINPAPTTVTLAPASACAAPNGPVTLNFNLNTFSYGSAAPTGTATVFTANPQVSAPITAVNATSVSTAGGTATFTLPSLPAGLNKVVVGYSGDSNYLPSTATTTVNVTAGSCFGAILNAANFATRIATGSLATVFGTQLTAASTLPTGQTLPQTLGGASVSFTDSLGVTQPADLSFAGPGQINLVIPPTLALGPATVQVSTAKGVSEYPVTISRLSPAFFTADGSGTGLAAAEILRVKSTGAVTYEPVITLDAQGKVTAKPIVFNGDRLSLILYGTGLANFGQSDFYAITLDGQSTEVSYIGPSSFEGLDQVNVDLPPVLAGSGSIPVQIFINGVASNAVTVTFQ